MPSLKDLKNRIVSVKSTRKITKAMQMVAAAKLRKAQDKFEAAKPYEKQITSIINRIKSTESTTDLNSISPLLASTDAEQDNVYLLLVMTSEKGLCGGFNSTIVRFARMRARALLDSGKDVKIITVGKKGHEQLKRDFSTRIVQHHEFHGGENGFYPFVQTITRDLFARFDNGEFDKAILFYNAFQSVIKQVPTERTIIPWSLGDDPNDTEPSNNCVYDYEPSAEYMLKALLPRAIKSSILAALLENSTSEQGARMAAMDSATHNAGDMIDKLTIQYNRSRQAAITKELIEIISGAEAL